MAVRGTAVKKFGRKTDQRAALVRSVARALILEGSIETTQSKAKAVRPFVEKLATKARKADLHSRRQIISSLHDVEATESLIERMAATDRTSGYLRITRTELRRGDSTQMAIIEFVDDFDPDAAPKAKETETKKPAKSAAKESPTEKKSTAKKETK